MVTVVDGSTFLEEFEKRNKLRVLEPWLEDRVKEGNVEPSLHNAIGKIYVSLNKGAKDWLLSNRFYDSSVVGKFCEKLDPFLAYLAYRRAWGKCDDDLIRVTNTHSLFKDQARYLVERQDMELWGKVQLALDDACSLTHASFTSSRPHTLSRRSSSSPSHPHLGADRRERAQRRIGERGGWHRPPRG